jgi:deazaflavin-dependent oxidoreductase (nitroreductase family)
MALTGDYEPSALGWVREHVEQIVRSGTTDRVTITGLPIVLMTYRGAKTGKLRKTPVLRVEHEGSYAAVASKGGAPTNPQWYARRRAMVSAATGAAVASSTASARAVANEDGAAAGDEFALSARSTAT